MDIGDERRKKLEAGKEKLAAFRKKKAKSKKAVRDNEESSNSKEIEESVKGDTTSISSIPDDFHASLPQAIENVNNLNDHFYPTDGNDIYPKEPNSGTSQIRDSQNPAVQHLGEPEKGTEELLITEFQPSLNQEAEQVYPDVELPDLEKALAQRDSLLQQLAHTLKSNADQHTEKEDLASQVLNLAQHVTQLQAQLKEADQTLQEQLQLDGISTSALQSAKRQMLQLQSILHAKDEEIILASQQLEKSHESLCHNKEENTRLSQELSEKVEELNNLQSSYDATVFSHEEKQEREQSEKSNLLSEFQNEWREKEEEMKMAVDSQAKEIEDWKKCEQEWKEKESHLRKCYENLESHLQQDNGKDERLNALEKELEEMRRLNQISEEEVANLNKKNEEQSNNYESCVSKLEALTDEHNQLSLTHSNVVDKFESLKSENSDLDGSFRQLTLENEALRSDLQELSSKLIEEQEKLKSSNEHVANLETKQNDKLNNKINELESSLSVSEKSLAETENALLEEKSAVEALQQEVLFKENSLAMLSQQLTDLSSRNSDLQSQLLTKEDQMQELQSMLSEKSSAEMTFKDKQSNLEEDKVKLEENVAKLTKELNELKNEYDKYTQDMIQQKNANEICGEEIFEKENFQLMNSEVGVGLKKADMLENESSERDENNVHESEKYKMLEIQLQTVEEQREELKNTIESMNEEICTLKEDLKNQRLQGDIIGEDLISMSYKLQEAENSVQQKILEMKRSELEYKAEADQFRSDIIALKNDKEKLGDISNELDLKLKSSTEDLGKVNDDLIKSEESLKNKTKDYESLLTEAENLKEIENQSVDKITSLEDDLKDLKKEYEGMVEKEKEYCQNQEEMQSQLESTVSQWQKLQLIVQEKEIELQNLHDDLDEQKRICSTLRKNHEEELNTVNSDVDTLKEAKESNKARVLELERILANLQNTIDAKEVEVLEATTKLQSGDSSVQSLTAQLSDRKKEMEEIASERDRFSMELSERLKDNSNIEEDLTKAKDEILSLNEELTKTNERILSLNDDLTEANDEVLSLNEDLTKAKNEISCLNGDLTKANDEISSLNEDLTKANDEISSLNEDLTKANDEISSLNEDLTKVKNEVLSLNEELSKANDEIISNQAKFIIEREEKESVLKNLENDNQQLCDKEKALMSQIENSQAQIEEIQGYSNDLTTESNGLKLLIPQLESKCLEKDNLLSQQQAAREELETFLDRQRQECNRLKSVLSSLYQDLQIKEEALVTSNTVLGEKVAETFQKDEDLAKSLQDIEMLQEDLKNARENIKTLEADLELTTKDKESVFEELKNRNSLVDEISVKRDDLNSQNESLKTKLEKMESNANEMIAENNQLTSQLRDLEAICNEKENLLSVEQDNVEQLTKQVNGDKEKCQRLEGLLSSLSEDLDNKEEFLVQQSALWEEKNTELSQISTDLNEKENMLRDMEENNRQLEARVEDLTSKEKTLEFEVSELRELVDKQEKDIAHSTVASLELHENLAKAEEDMKTKEKELLDLKQDNDIMLKECNDLKTDIQVKESQNHSLENEVEMMKSDLQTSSQEKEMLKNNFDACLEEMQQTSTTQESEFNRWKSQIAEESRNRHESQDELKEMYVQQLAQMEDKLVAMEREKSQVEKEVEEEQTKLSALKDYCEQQMSEFELSLQAAQSETMKLNDVISKITSDHEKEVRDLKSLHELQTSELMENCFSLEKSVADLQKNLNDQAGNMKQERNEMELSFENLMSEMDERKRRSDSDMTRLKMHQEEMKKDHEQEVKAVEKRYEHQVFDLEDRCSIMTSDMDRLRKSMLGVEGDFVDERRILEGKIEDLENLRRDLQIKCSILEDDIFLLKEQSSSREEEVKSILKKAAEKESELNSDVLDLKEQLRTVKSNSKSSDESLRKEFESKIDELGAENKHLRSRLNTFELNDELDKEMRDQHADTDNPDMLSSRLKEMKKQMAVLTDENLTLKRRLLGQKSLEKKGRLLSGVEDICPPLQETRTEKVIIPSQMTLVTSTPTKKDPRKEEPYSPTADEVSLIQGFVSESHEKPLSAVKLETVYAVQSGAVDEEPDFVAEETDRFQPEMVIEKAVEDYGRMKSNIHPIQEGVVMEGFQPEVTDQFFVEIMEETGAGWPIELSVGTSPTTKKAPDFPSVIDEEDGGDKTFQQRWVEGHENETTSPLLGISPSVTNTDERKQNADELEKHLEQMKDDLEEQYVFKLRKQQLDIMTEYETKQESMQKEMEQHFAQKEQSIRNDWERKFAKALQKLKKDFDKKLQKQLLHSQQSSKRPQLKSDVAHTTTGYEEDGLPTIGDESEELGNVVEQLSKENQELAEVRDILLKQIEMTQNRGLHNRVQNELQSMLAERERDNTSSHNILVTPTNTAPLQETDMKRSVGLDTDADSSRTEISETSSAAAERFLEELEDISQQSSQDLPLEWELTNTIATEPGASEIEMGHQSVWEVFDSRCLRQDCQEVRHRYRRLCQCVVKSFGLREDNVASEESGLLPQEGQNDVEDKEDTAKGFISTQSKWETNYDKLDDDELDDLLADNVALESELLSLAENMVLYRQAFVKQKNELEKENEFLRLELETEATSRKENEEKYLSDKEDMVTQIEVLENQLAFIDKNSSHEINIELCNKEVMTDQLSHYDTNLAKLELENSNLALEEKTETIAILHLDIEHLKSEFEDSFSQCKENTESKIKVLQEELADLKSENDYLFLTHDGKEDTIAGLQADSDQLRSDLDDVMNKLSTEKQKVSDLDNEMSSLVDKISDLQSTHEVKVEQIAILGKEVNQLQSEKEDLTTKLSAKDNKLDEFEKEVVGLKEQNVDLRSGLDEKEKQILCFNKDISQLRSEQEEQTKSLSLKDDQLEALEREAMSLKDEKKELNSALELQEEKIANLNTDVKKLITQQEDLEENSASKDDKVQVLESKISTMKDKDITLLSLLEEKEKTIADLDQDIIKMKSDQEIVAKLLSKKDSQIDILESQAANVEYKHISVHSVFDKQTNCIKGLGSELSQLKNQLQDVKEEKDCLHMKDDEKTDTITRLEGELQHLKTQLQELWQASSSDGDRVKMLAEEVSILRDDNDRLRTTLEVKEENVAKSEIGFKDLKNDLEIMESQMSSLKDDNKDLRLSSEMKEENLAKSALELCNLKNDLETLEDQVSSLKDETTNLRSDLQMKEENMEKCEFEVNDLKNKKDILENEVSTLKDDEDNLKSVLKEAKENLAKSELEIECCENKVDLLQDQVLNLKGDKSNLEMSLELNEENLEKAKSEIINLMSQLQELSDTLENAQGNISRLKTLEDEVGILKDENESLLSHKEENEEIIVGLRQEIGQLKDQLREMLAGDRRLMLSDGQDKMTDEEMVLEELSREEGEVSDGHSVQSSGDQSSGGDEVQNAVKEDEMIHSRVWNTEQGMKESCGGSEGDVRSVASSVTGQTEGFMSVEKVDPLTCPMKIETSSISEQEESLFSSTNSLLMSNITMDQSSGRISPTDLQDQALAKELNQLKKDLRETKAIYSRENSLLHEALQREKRVTGNVLNKNDTETDSVKGNIDGENENKSESFDQDSDLEHRLAVCIEQNKMLEEENSKLRTKIRKQEAVVLIYKHRLSEKEHDSELWRKSLTSQLQALQKQRDDLVQLLRNQEMGSIPTMSEVIGQAALKEESLRRVQDDLMEKMEELDHLHQMLTQRQVELQHCDVERRHLEQLCLLKDQTEMQLTKQKRLMEEQVSEIENRLHERETILMEEKSKLVEELKEKDDCLMQMSQPQSPRNSLSPMVSRSYSMGDLHSGSLGLASGAGLSSSAEDADKQHLKAIDTLREKLRLEYSLRSSRLAESQASAVASYWMRHQNKSDQTP